MKKEISGLAIECIQGNIVAQTDIDAVVNAANSELLIGGGVAGAIHRTAGHELEAECRPLAPIKPGEAVITKGYNLPNPFCIHCLGPVYGVDKPEEELLRNCYLNALELAENNNIKSIAFPAISSGAFGYPIEAAADIAFKTIVNKAKVLKQIKRVRFVLYSNKSLQIHENVLSRLTALL